MSERPDAATAAEKAFSTLLAFVQSCKDAGELPVDDTLTLALLAWSMVHGVAKLAITGRLPFSSNADVLKFLGFVIDKSLPSGAA